MQRTVASLIIALALILVAGSVDVSGQEPCSVASDFASLRELVGAQKVGDCLEQERVNPQTGSSEQRTSGGLLIRSAGSAYTAFTDGVTTWLNGPNGLESRANDQRFAWETDPAALAASAAAMQAGATPTTAPEALPPVTGLPAADTLPLPPPPSPLPSPARLQPLPRPRSTPLPQNRPRRQRRPRRRPRP